MTGEQHLLSDHVPSMGDLKRDYLEMRAEHYGFVDLYAQEWDRAIKAHDAEVRALPDREEAIEGLRVAMLGTTDGDFIHPESPIPAGEMFRLASHYLEALFGQETA